MESASERLSEELAKMPEDERERVAEDVLGELRYRDWVRRELQIGIDQADRGEVAPLETQEAFMERMRAKYGFD